MLQSVLAGLLLLLTAGANAQAQQPLPTADEIKQSIAAPWRPAAMIDPNEVYDRQSWIRTFEHFDVRTMGKRDQWPLAVTAWNSLLNEFSNEIARAEPYAQPVAHWRFLVLLYPNTYTDYIRNGQTLHYRGSLTAQQINKVQATFSQFSDFIRRQTGGFCDAVVDYHTVNRPVNLSHNQNDLGYFRPDYSTDCAPEKQAYDSAEKHNSVIIIFNSGPIPESLKGVGGGGESGTVMQVRYAPDREWNPNDLEATFRPFVHEWIHGLDSLFYGRGYHGLDLHHVYTFPDGGYNGNLHAPLLQGRMLDILGQRYGFSRSAWLTGESDHLLKGPWPVQLSNPLPATALPQGAKTIFSWNPRPHAVAYRFLIYRLHDYAAPALSKQTDQTAISVNLRDFKPGQYVWTVQSIDSQAQTSPVGESFIFNLLDPADIASIQVRPASAPQRQECFPMVDVAATSPCGITSVQVAISYPDGRQISSPLYKVSPADTDPLWVGSLPMLSQEEVGHAGICQTKITATDAAGRTKTVDGFPMTLCSSPTTSTADLPVELLNPITVRQGPNEDSDTGATVELTSGPTSEIPTAGGPRALYVKLGATFHAGGWSQVAGAWATAHDDGGNTFRIGLDRWFSFNGMCFGVFQCPENTSGHKKTWKVEYHMRYKDGPEFVSAPETLTQHE